MSMKLPPLNAMRAFEAAARHSSFTKAADELCVTPAAISQQIKFLEDYLQIRFFIRSNKGIAMTEAGKTYYPLVTEGFQTLARATRRLNSFKSSDHLNVSILPSLASQWLGRYLFEWCVQYPDIQITVQATHNEEDLNKSEYDIRITYGERHYQNTICEQLVTDSVSPVCSPALLQKENQLLSPSDLKNFRLLHIDWGGSYDTLPSWDEWLSAANVESSIHERSPIFNLSSLAIQAAVKGEGVVLGQNLMVRDEIASGLLVKPFELSLPLREAYYITYTESTLSKPGAQIFLAWLRNLCSE